MKTSFGEFSFKEIALSVSLALGLLVIVWFIMFIIFI